MNRRRFEEGEEGENSGPIHRTVIPVVERKLGPKLVDKSKQKDEGEVTRMNLTIGDLRTLAMTRVEKLAGMNWLQRAKTFLYLITLSEDIEEKKMENPLA